MRSAQSHRIYYTPLPSATQSSSSNGHSTSELCHRCTKETRKLNRSGSVRPPPRLPVQPAQVRGGPQDPFGRHVPFRRTCRSPLPCNGRRRLSALLYAQSYLVGDEAVRLNACSSPSPSSSYSMQRRFRSMPNPPRTHHTMSYRCTSALWTGYRLSAQPVRIISVVVQFHTAELAAAVVQLQGAEWIVAIPLSWFVFSASLLSGIRL
jgi:hypothetical protein